MFGYGSLIFRFDTAEFFLHFNSLAQRNRIILTWGRQHLDGQIIDFADVLVSVRVMLVGSTCLTS